MKFCGKLCIFLNYYTTRICYGIKNVHKKCKEVLSPWKLVFLITSTKKYKQALKAYSKRQNEAADEVGAGREKGGAGLKWRLICIFLK